MLTPDGKVFLITLGIALATYLLGIVVWAIWCIFKRDGICPVPKITLFGFWGSAPLPFLMFIALDHVNHKPLIEHERCHQHQQRRDGLFTFWWKYITSKEARQNYEVEAYRVWYQTEPKELRNCVWALTKSYGFKLTEKEAINLLTK